MAVSLLPMQKLYFLTNLSGTDGYFGYFAFFLQDASLP